VHKTAGATPGIAVGQYSPAILMLLQDALADSFGEMEHRSTGRGAANRRSERDHRSDVPWPLARNRACDHPSQAMTDPVNSPSGFGQGSCNRVVQMALDQEIWTLGVDSNPGKIGLISDALQPGVKFHRIKIGAEETRNNHHSRSVAARHAEAIIDGSCVQKENLGRKQRFCPG